jgi:hypothetical protein
MLKFNLHLIDEWEGESFLAKIDENPFFVYSYNWCEKLIP